MFYVAQPDKRWSKFGVRLFIGSLAAAFLLIALHAVLWGSYTGSHYNMPPSAGILDIGALDLKDLAGFTVVAAAILIVGARFLETRTILSIGFDKLDAAKMVCKGPDEENIVWIGRRYDSQFEAQVIAEALARRLKDGAEGI